MKQEVGGWNPKQKIHQVETAATEAQGGNMVCNCLLGNVAPRLSLRPNKLNWGVGDRGENLFVGCIPAIIKS